MINENGVSPLVVANRLTPLWMRRIKEFDNVEIWPCKTIDINGRDNTVMCKREEATLWVVYGHKSAKEVPSGGSLEPLNQFFAEGEAERFCNRLRAAYPHLNKDRPPPRSTPHEQPTP